MTRFTFQGSGQTVGGDGKGLLTLVAIGAGVAVTYEAVKSAASTLGDLLVIVPVALGSLAVGVVVTYVAVNARRPRQSVSAGRPVAAALWTARADALPPREVRAIAPAPAVTVNIDADLLAGLMRTAQQQAVRVTPVTEIEELPR